MMTMDDTTGAVYRDTTRPVDERVEDLLARMTLEEKVAQLTGILPFDLLGATGLDEQRFEEHLAEGIGEISAGALLSPDPARLVSMLDQLQRYLVEQTRLGIPAIVHHEALAGLVHQACADFPTALTMAASWDPLSVETAMRDVVRPQMRALGVHQACSPNLDLARDARWGRVQETYGEDPYLGSAIGVAFIRGLQGDDRREGVLATAKHFLGYAMAYGGRNIGAVQLGERELLEVYARPFGAAISEAGLESVMCAYSDLNGEPAAASRRLLTDMLRGTLGFRGLTVADYGAVNALATRQRTATDSADAGVQALAAGLDVELPGSLCYVAGIAPAVRDGVLDESVVDDSVRRVLDAKFRLGLFENPYGDVEAFAATDTDGARQLARRIATRSTVLLANPNNVLPLPRDLSRIAVIGPNAKSIRNLFGGYSAPAAIEMMTSGDMALPPVLGGELDAEPTEAPARVEDPVDESSAETSGGTGDDFGFVRRIATHPSARALAAIEAAYPNTLTVLDSIRAVVADGTEVVYALGCDVNDPSTEGIPEAVDAAKDSDVAVLVLGDKTGLVSDAMIGETRDRSTLELAGAQRPLLEAVCATGVPVVVVLLGSQPQPVLAVEGGPAAVIHAYQPGSVGGVAIADVLFGLENPSGRVPVTIPRTAGQSPIYHGFKNGSDPSTYTDLDDSGPAYAFGHGLSYTTFEYTSIAIDAAEVEATGSVGVHVTVVNTGDRSGEEVVQLYASIRRRGVTRPVQELVGFHRVSLEPGEQATVTFTLEPGILAYYDVGMNLVVTPGDVHLLAGPSSASLPLTATFTIIGDPAPLESRTVHLTSSSVVPAPPG